MVVPRFDLWRGITGSTGYEHVMTESENSNREIPVKNCKRCGDPITVFKPEDVCGPCEIWGCEQCYDGILQSADPPETREQNCEEQVLAQCTVCGHETWETQ